MMSKAENLSMKGLMSIRAAKALVKHGGRYFEAVEATRTKDPQVSQFLEKSFTPGATIEDALAIAEQPVAREFGEYIFSQSIPGKLLVSALQLPFYSDLSSISGIGADWVQEGKAIPVRKGAVSKNKLKAFKIASIAVVSNELLRLAATGADLAMRNVMVSEAVKKIDAKFLSDDAEVEDVSPAGLLVSATHAASYAEMIETHIANGNSLSTSFMIFPYSAVFSLTEIQIQQLSLLGIRLLSSQAATKTTLIDAANTIINVQGALVDTATEGAVEMTDAPANDIQADSGTELVSLYQANSAALRAITYCSWAPAGKPVTVLDL